MKLTYKIVRKHTITGKKDFQQNPKRIGLLIQNLSTDTIYFMSWQQTDITQSIEVDGNSYSDEIGASAAFSLNTSGSSSEVRIEEIIEV